jgi:RNA polymerase sigma factor (sigma-70 family)
MEETKDKEKARQSKFEKDLLPHINALHTFAYHLSYNDEDAMDLVQETYLKAYKAIDSYDEGTNAKAWLFKILKNNYINQYRRKSKRPRKVDLEDYIGLYEKEDSNLSGKVDLRQEIYEDLMGDEVTIAVNSLPIDFRTVILLCDVEGFTYEEISKILDVPIGTVRSRLHRARNLLKEKLQAYAQKKGFKDMRG